MDSQGIIVGADQTQEWLLPWWWDRYRKYNDYPVAFFDFGLSLEKKEWCRQRGPLIPLRLIDFAEERQNIAPTLIQNWEDDFGTRFWESRGAWFKKPVACSQSPFENTLWIDLDCEILGSTAPIFQYSDHPSGLALMKERSEKTIYNSGVIAFRKNNVWISEWARQTHLQHHLFRGDQELLTAILQDTEVGNLPPIYNWLRVFEPNPNMVIHHLHGEPGRTAIQYRLNVEVLIEQFGDPLKSPPHSGNGDGTPEPGNRWAAKDHPQ